MKRFISLRYFISIVVLLLGTTTSRMEAQFIPDIEPGIQGAIARVYDGPGHVFAVDLRWRLPVELLGADHSLGFQGWYGISHVRGSHIIGYDRRRLMGVGLDWQSSLRLIDGHLRPYVSLPLHLVRSSIFSPFGTYLTPHSGGDPATQGIPSYNLPGAKVGMAYGVGGGCQLWFPNEVGVDAGVTVLKQHLYEDDGPPWTFFTLGLRYAMSGMMGR